LDAWIKEFLVLRARAALGDEKSPTFLGEVLGHAGLGASKQETFAGLYAEHGAMTPALLDAGKKAGALTEQEVEDVATSFKLADISHGDFSVVRAIKERFDIRRPEDLPNLAKRTERDWIALVEHGKKEGTLRIPIASNQASAPVAPPDGAMYART